MADCLFCRIIAGEIPSEKVHEDELVVAIRDVAPRAPVHVLLLPRTHVASAREVGEADGAMLGRLFAVGARIAAARARRARYVSYLMGAVVGTIGVLMSGKPQLW